MHRTGERKDVPERFRKKKGGGREVSEGERQSSSS